MAHYPGHPDFFAQTQAVIEEWRDNPITAKVMEAAQEKRDKSTRINMGHKFRRALAEATLNPMTLEAGKIDLQSAWNKYVGRTMEDEWPRWDTEHKVPAGQKITQKDVDTWVGNLIQKKTDEPRILEGTRHRRTGTGYGGMARLRDLGLLDMTESPSGVPILTMKDPGKFHPNEVAPLGFYGGKGGYSWSEYSEDDKKAGLINPADVPFGEHKKLEAEGKLFKPSLQWLHAGVPPHFYTPYGDYSKPQGQDYIVQGPGSTGDLKLSTKPLSPSAQLVRDSTTWHEIGHSEKGWKPSGENTSVGQYDTSIPWSLRPEEERADAYSLNVLKENLRRANMGYSQGMGFDYMIPSRTGEMKGEVVPNPSQVPYYNRLDYLPIIKPGQGKGGYDPNRKWPTMSMDALGRIKTDMKGTTDLAEYFTNRRDLGRALFKANPLGLGAMEHPLPYTGKLDYNMINESGGLLDVSEIRNLPLENKPGYFTYKDDLGILKLLDYNRVISRSKLAK